MDTIGLSLEFLKNMKANIFILLLLFFFLSSCDPYILRIAVDGEAFEKSFNFECGKVDIVCNVLADRQISVFQKFKLDSPILINPEKLEIVHKGEELTANVYSKNAGLIKDAKTINADDEVRITISRVVQVGDTLKINIDNFIVCKEKPLEIGDVNLVLVRRK